jgi:ssRNA-specific RNase YbeY (16S rRNA maturation enzyme)
MKAKAIYVGIVLMISSSSAQADDAEKAAIARVRLTTEAALAAGCTRLGLVSDDSVKDLRRKILRTGGNTGVISFRLDDLSRIYADVFWCPPRTTAPPNVPPPPPGAPPPPPSGPSR